MRARKSVFMPQQHFYRQSENGNAGSSTYKPINSTLLGRKVEMRFSVNKINLKIKWFNGEINSYDGRTGKYGIFFPSDGETVYVFPDDKDIRFLE